MGGGSKMNCFADELSALLASKAGGSIDVASLMQDFPDGTQLVNSDGETALTLMAASGEYEAVKLLCELKADVAVSGHLGETPLLRAAKTIRGGFETVSILVEHRVDVT